MLFAATGGQLWLAMALLAIHHCI